VASTEQTVLTGFYPEGARTRKRWCDGKRTRRPGSRVRAEGEAPVEGPWVDRVNAIENVQLDIVMMVTPDGHGRLELTKFHHPQLVEIEPAIAPPNALGPRSVMFAVGSVDETVGRLRAVGGELIGEVAQH
jgi:hypothetical protein